MAIRRPQAHQRRAALRAVVEALAQTNPVSGGLATLYRVTHPPKSEIELQQWIEEVTDKLNEPGIFTRYNGVDHTFNVSSVTDLGVGLSRIEFTAPAASAHYEPIVGAKEATAIVTERTPNSVTVRTERDGQVCDAEFWVILPSHTEPA